MRIGPITIRWTKDVKRGSTKLVEAQEARYEAETFAHHQQRISDDLRAHQHRLRQEVARTYDQGASGKSKTPKAGVAHL